MQRKFLEDLGLEKDAIDKIMAENGADIEKAKGAGSTDLQTKISELNTANETIRTLKANVEKFKQFEGVDVKALQEEVKQAKIDAAVQIALAQNKAADVDYLLFKAKTSDKKVTVDENGKVTGVDELITELKTSCPTMFEKSSGTKVEEIPLEHGDNGTGGDEPTSLKGALEQFYEKPNE